MGHEVSEDIGFERRYWRAQRLAWVAMLVIVALALAGLFGGGPLSYYVVQGRGPLAVDAVLPRFSRFTDSEVGLMQVSASVPPGTSQIAIGISRTLLDLLGPQRIQPPPNRTLQSADAVFYVFDLTGSGGRAQATIEFQPKVAGLAWGTVSVQAGSLRSDIGPFWSFVFP